MKDAVANKTGIQDYQVCNEAVKFSTNKCAKYGPIISHTKVIQKTNCCKLLLSSYDYWKDRLEGMEKSNPLILGSLQPSTNKVQRRLILLSFS